MAICAMEQVSVQENRNETPQEVCYRTQRHFDFYEAVLPTASIAAASEKTRCKSSSELFASVKRVSLVYEGSLNERPCISSSSDAISFFKRYWQQAPCCDQEKFVVACMDTKNRIQCVVVVTIWHCFIGSFSFPLAIKPAG